MIQAVGFDLDGTLFDHSRAAREGIARLLASLGQGSTSAVELEWLRLEDVHFPDFAAGSIDLREFRLRRLRDILSHVSIDVGENRFDSLFEEYLAHYETSWGSAARSGDTYGHAA